LTEVQDHYFKEDFAISAKDGFRVAAGVTTAGNFDEEEDPEIGTVEFYIKGWKDDGLPP